MAENDENNDDQKEIKVERATLGAAQKFDPNAPQEDVSVSERMLDARQEAIGETRKYAGPVSDEKIETLSEEMDDSEVPPTDCAEPEGTEK